jgi:hypothetical protein
LLFESITASSIPATATPIFFSTRAAAVALSAGTSLSKTRQKRASRSAPREVGCENGYSRY